ncbi:MAG: S8 family serine peptidase [bacterium]|nr:S8 family serine peptidase [bacterium]
MISTRLTTGTRRATLITALIILLGVRAEAGALKIVDARPAGLETTKQLAAIAAPEWHTVPPEGDTLAGMLRTICGTQTPSTLQFLEQEAVRLNRAGTATTMLGAESAVLLPFCVPAAQAQVEVEPGDTLSDLLLRSGTLDEEMVDLTWELNKNTLYKDYAGQEHFVHHLLPERGVVVPTTLSSTRFVTLSDASFSNRPEITNLFMSYAEGVEEVESAPNSESDPGLQFVRFVAPADVAECTDQPHGGNPFDHDRVWNRFLSERARLTQYRKSPETAIVGIVDTGIVGGANWTLLPQTHFEPNVYELFGQRGVDDDRPAGNDQVDDVYGINFNQRNGSFETYPHDPDREHGTKIASAVLGGKALLAAVAPEDIPIRLKIVNLSSADLPGPVEARYVSDAVDYLDQQGADIVNMSLATPRHVVPHWNSMRDAEDTLFVVAAGNRGGGGENLDLAKLYPADYGGTRDPHSPHVLTVGAHDSELGPAWFSNFSESRVDLFAPGCGVSVLGAADFVLENGTSVSTAIVSFAAGLIRALGEEHPLNIKHRLVASVDVDRRLAEKAWTSGRLNVVKAISLSQDVVETADGTLTFGRIAAPTQLNRYCADPSTRRYLTSVMKVRPNIPAEGGSEIQYWLRIDGDVQIVSCKQQNQDQPLGEFFVDDIAVAAPALSQVRDIVLRSR